MQQISPQHIISYFQCPKKAYLLLSNSVEQYVQTEYEILINKAKEKAIETYYKKSGEAQFYDEGILIKGIPVIYNTKINIQDFNFDSKLLLKKEGKSSLGKFYYEPAIFIGTNKIALENRMELAFLGFLLEKLQNTFPGKGVIIDKHGNEHRVDLSKLKKLINPVVAEILDFDKNPPRLTLNNHCTQCPFNTLCKTQAIKEDNLTLLDRITPKQIFRFEKKGIFTVKQLSYIYKPRRKSKRAKTPKISYVPELQALAIRTEKTYIQALPALERKSTEIFLDIEGIPDDDFFYLFGILLYENGKQVYHSFWSDTLKDEEVTWRKVVNYIGLYPETPIYHYGSFEPLVFNKLSKKYKTDIQNIKKRFTNINSSIFGKIYFPTYSNGLKYLGQALGMKWFHEKASGLQSIVWRNYWENGQDEYKNYLLTYNEEDCIALKILTEELTRIQLTAAVSTDVEFVQNPKKIASEISNGMHNQFNLILQLAHHDYDRKKIKINLLRNETSKIKQEKKIKKGDSWLGKTIGKPNKSIIVQPDKYCFKHNERQLNKSHIKTRRVILDLVFSKKGVRKTLTEYIGHHGYCPICNNSIPPLIIRQLSRQLYGHNYKAWYVYQRIEIQLSFSKINQFNYEIIKEKIGNAYGSELIKSFSQNYEDTEKQIILNILSSTFIHADETTVSILGENQYVWIFTTDKHVIFKLSRNREASTAIDFLKDYKGILISDFFSGYDNIECLQQKCWVHFIRNLNNSLWDNPFDKEYESFVCEIRNLIVPIIQATDQFGLKTHFLAKYQKTIDKFYKLHIDNKVYKSEPCNLYQKRFKRYRNSLFTFIKHNETNWHNNPAENGLRHICVQRKISGSFGGNQFPYYLRMVGILQTCKLQNKSFFKFLLSKENDVNSFRGKRKAF